MRLFPIALFRVHCVNDPCDGHVVAVMPGDRLVFLGHESTRQVEADGVASQLAGERRMPACALVLDKVRGTKMLTTSGRVRTQCLGRARWGEVRVAYADYRAMTIGKVTSALGQLRTYSPLLAHLHRFTWRAGISGALFSAVSTTMWDTVRRR